MKTLGPSDARHIMFSKKKTVIFTRLWKAKFLHNNCYNLLMIGRSINCTSHNQFYHLQLWLPFLIAKCCHRVICKQVNSKLVHLNEFLELTRITKNIYITFQLKMDKYFVFLILIHCNSDRTHPPNLISLMGIHSEWNIWWCRIWKASQAY